MGALDRSDAHQQRAHEKMSRDGIVITPAAKVVLVVMFGGSLVAMLIAVVGLIVGG